MPRPVLGLCVGNTGLSLLLPTVKVLLSTHYTPLSAVQNR